MTDLFESLGGTFVTPKTVLEASLPLELSGEVVRGRICVFTDEDGREWALRPDLTLPVAMAEIARRREGAEGAQTVRYAAPVFRLPAQSKEPVEFLQAGFERFGYASDAANDAEAFAAIAEAVQACGASLEFVQFGDLCVFPAFVDALGLPMETTAGLKRAFRQEGGVRAFLNAEQGMASNGLVRRIQGMAQDDVADFVEDVFSLTGVRPVGERSAAEIVERLYQRAQSREGIAVPERAKALLEDVLAVKVAASEAGEALSKIAKSANLTGLDPVFEHLDERMSLIGQRVPEALEGARFATRYGRRFTYYDGFVFEIAASETESEAGLPFATGGRYDSLLSDLSGGEIDVSALGGIINPHRLESAKGARR